MYRWLYGGAGHHADGGVKRSGERRRVNSGVEVIEFYNR
jgi:hypothetical protein